MSVISKLKTVTLEIVSQFNSHDMGIGDSLKVIAQGTPIRN